MKYVVASLMLSVLLALEVKAMVLDEFKKHLETYRGNGGIATDGIPPHQTPRDTAFLLYVAEDWRRASTLLEMEGLDFWQQCMIIIAAEYLQPKDYVRFLNGVCDLTESGKLEITRWGYFVLCAACGKDGFLDYNYDNPEVLAVINRLEALFKTQAPEQWEKQWKDYFSKMKSGKLKKGIIEEYAEYGRLPETYEDNSKEMYHLLERIHKGLLAGRTIEEVTAEESKKEKGQVQPQTVPKEGNPAVAKRTTDSVATEDKQPSNEPTPTKTTPWKIPLLIAIIATAGAIMAWLYFRKGGRNKL